MMDKAPVLDLVVVCYGIFAAFCMIILAIFAFLYRKDPIMRARNVPMTCLMCVGAAVHIISEVVANRHLNFLSAIEVTSCPLWGYWLPYVFGVGLFFVGLYLRLFTYTTAISREFSALSAMRARRLRLPVAIATLLPIVLITVLVTIAPGATFTDSGACKSQNGYKAAVGVWLGTCIFALVLSVFVFRYGYVRDIVREARKQVFVAILGTIVFAAVVFVLIFAEDGLDRLANRAIATFSISTLYLWALGIMCGRPLWKVVRGDTSYSKIHDEQLELIEQPIESIRTVLERGEDRRAVRLLFADFLSYCKDETTPMMDLGGGKTASAQHTAALYGAMDNWTHTRPSTFGDQVDADQFPPLVSNDISRTSRDILAHWFSRPGAPQFVDIGMDSSLRDYTTGKHMSEGDVTNLFRRAMWWTVDRLDHFYGSHYLQTVILTRGIFSSAADGSVRLLLQDLRRSEAKLRVQQANLVDKKDSSSEVESKVAVEVEEDDDERETVPLEDTGTVTPLSDSVNSADSWDPNGEL